MCSWKRNGERIGESRSGEIERASEERAPYSRLLLGVFVVVSRCLFSHMTFEAKLSCGITSAQGSQTFTATPYPNHPIATHLATPAHWPTHLPSSNNKCRLSVASRSTVACHTLIDSARIWLPPCLILSHSPDRFADSSQSAGRRPVVHRKNGGISLNQPLGKLWNLWQCTG